MIHDFTPIPALIGGVLIGLSATALMRSYGRVMGCSGIFAGVLNIADERWRASFVVGMIVAGLAMTVTMPYVFGTPQNRPLAVILIAGLLVGFGTRMGNGCTSGHGICGLTRYSMRSLVAVLTFMATGIATATGYSLLTATP